MEERQMRASFAKVAIAASAALVLASCAMPADDPNFNSNTGLGGEAISSEEAAAVAEDQAALDSSLAAPTSIGVDAPLAAAPAEGAVIISLTDGSAYEAVFQTALAEAGTTLGWTVETVAVSEADPTTAATAFDEAVAKAPAGIHITGEFLEAVTPGLAAAETAGIPVICTGCSGEPSGAIKDTSIDGTAQNLEWANVLSTYVVSSQYAGEDAGVQIFSEPGGAIIDFNTQFTTNLLELCRNCSASESMVDAMMVDKTDPAALPAFVTGEMAISLGAWALMDSGELSPGAAEALAADLTLLSPITVIGRGASAADIELLKGLGGAAAPADPTASDAAASDVAADQAAADDAAALEEGIPEEGATDAAAEVTGRTPEEAAALQAWIAIPQPVMAWRVIDQFARIIGGEAPATGPLPSQLLTGANVADAVLDENGNYIGIADYQDQFKTLWGVK